MITIDADNEVFKRGGLFIEVAPRILRELADKIEQGKIPGYCHVKVQTTGPSSSVRISMETLSDTSLDLSGNELTDLVTL
jgi:hypothetical protein